MPWTIEEHHRKNLYHNSLLWENLQTFQANPFWWKDILLPFAPMVILMWAVQMDSLCKTTTWLRDELDSPAQNIRILDCRSRELYDSSHVEKALHVALPGLMLRRLRKGNLTAHSLLPGSPPVSRGVALLYDECTASLPTRVGVQSEEQETVLITLLQKLRKEGCTAYYLQGKRWHL